MYRAHDGRRPDGWPMAKAAVCPCSEGRIADYDDRGWGPRPCPVCADSDTDLGKPCTYCAAS